MFEPILVTCGVFTDAGRGWLLGQDEEGLLVQLAGTGEMRHFAVEAVRNVEQEIRRRAAQVGTDVVEEHLALVRSKELGHFPDMTRVELPNGPRKARKIPRGLQNLERYGVYRPGSLPLKFEAHLVANSGAVKRNVRWAEHVHARVLSTLIQLGIGVPENVRFIDTGARVEDAEQAGGFMAFTEFPAPPDLEIVPLEFFKGHKASNREKQVKNGTMRIGNGRLAFGIDLWPGALFPPIHFLTHVDD